VTDRRLLAAFAALPREMFRPTARRALGYSDASLEVWPAVDATPPRFLLTPTVLAKLIQLAEVEAGDRVLDVGCMTGYSTAILARLASSVVGLEAEPELAAAASSNLRALGIANAEIVDGPLDKPVPSKGPYDVILLNGSVPALPEALSAQLKDGSRLVAIIAGAGATGARQGRAYRFVRSEGDVSGVSHFDANARPLPAFVPAPCFTF
jgi:protein-L-isoaspartate(D-aspartate) O-methyltransferase